MKAVVIVSRALFGILGVTLLVLGIVFWTGHALALVRLHIALGFVFALLLWVLAAVGAGARAPMGVVVTAFLWGLVLPMVGIAQLKLMPGANHWVIRVVHLLTGIVAMGLAGRLSAVIAASGNGRAGSGSTPPASSR